MISLFTGLPGNGKTLFALWYIKSKAEKEKRKVFYYNIKELALSWELFDPLKWMDLPYGSIIVIDECQEVFPKKPNGSKLPEYYEELAKHRHYGFDIFLITQHPTLLDNFVRKLVGQHFHSVRKFGLERSTIYEWSATVDSPEKPSAHKNALTLKFKYPKEAYTWYKSAEVHTVKKSIPMKLILAVAFIVAVPVVGYFQLHHYQNRFKHDDDKRSDNSAAISGAPGVGGVGASNVGFSPASVAGRVPFDPVADARAYVQASTPRIVGLLQTAPKYDELTKPSRVPIPAACIQKGSVSSHKEISCKCFSQQGTPLPVETNMCIEFARNGFFQDFDAERDRVAQDRTQAGVVALSNRPDSPLPVVARSSSVVAFADVPDAKKPSSPPLQWGH
jgi:zona occludens toxin